MDELLEQFLIEGRDLVAQASRDFATLAKEPGNGAAIDSAFRAIHTLKGSVAVFALAPAEQLLHAAEDLLEKARKGSFILDAASVTALVASLDIVDRWIDEMETAGTLSAGASALADRGIAALAAPVSGPPLTADASSNGNDNAHAGGWLAALADREADIIAHAGRPLTAFRYAPSADCFFRGDDPLSLVATVPELATLRVLPAEGAWPALEEIEPFTCFSVLEGLSGAQLEAVRAVFRLVPDQVELAALDPQAGQAIQEETVQDGRATGPLRVASERVEALADGLGELIVAINAFTPIADDALRFDPGLAARLRKAQAELERLTGQLHRTVSAVRSVPLEPALRRLPRLAREIAEGLGKRVSFDMTLDGIEVDKQVADGLFEPLLHLLRNALDHGIESPERREMSGKDPLGHVSLTARRDGNAIAVTLADDGGGIDPARIRRTAIEKGLIGAAEAEGLSDTAALQLIFIPGFSTAGAVSELSGRGVGMDVVRQVVARLQGSIDLSSTLGAGTVFRIRLPINALITRLLVVEVCGDRYGIALDQVVETVRIDRAALVPLGLGVACVLRGRTIPVLSLAQLLGGIETDRPSAKLVVTHCGGEPVALRVDGFAERIDTIVRPTGKVLRGIPGLSGSALLGDGDVLLVLDLPELAA